MTDLEILHDTFSIVGTKRLAFPSRSTPENFILFSDTGGILGQPFKKTLSFSSFSRKARIVVLADPDKIVGHIKFEAGKEVVFSYPDRAELLDLLFDTTAAMDESSRARVSATSAPSRPLNIWFPAKFPNFEFTESQATAIKDDPLWQSAGVLNGDCLSVRLEVEKQRVTLRLFDRVVAELPLSAAALSFSDKMLRCNNRLLIDDQRVEGFTIEFPTPETAARWLELVGMASIISKDRGGATTPALVDLIGEVHVEGILNGQRLERSAGDARMDGSTIRILDPSGAEYFSFDFASPTLAIDGTAAEFLASPDSSTAVLITSESKPFLRAIYTNDSANAAVIRTSNVGPFIARDTEGRFVRIESTREGAEIGYDGGQVLPVPPGVERPVLGIAGGQPVLHVADYAIHAELPALEGISGLLTGMSVRTLVAENFEKALAQILALEGKFLTHCVFGKLAQVHITLSEALKVDPRASWSLAIRGGNREPFLAAMAELARDLSLDCETVLNYFAGYVIGQDREFLSLAGLSNSMNYAAAESGYQSAVNGIGSFLSHFGRIEALMAQFTSTKKFAARKEGAGALAAQTALGFIPGLHFLWIGAAVQGAALKNRSDMKSSVATETIDDLFFVCAREWDLIVRTLLPAISHRFAGQIYPLRLAITHNLRKAVEAGDQKAKEKAYDAVARRLGRLIASLDFPSAAGLATKRSHCIDFVWERQSHAEGMHERRF